MGGCVVRCGVLCCFFWLCLCTEDAVSSHNCSAEIRFPSLDVSLDDDNTPTTLHFEVVSKCNDDLGQYRLVIRTTDGSHTDLSYLEGTSLCSIRSVEPSNRCGGQCNQTARGLSCRATDTFHRRPHRTWKVEGNNNIIAKIAVFNVSYPTNFTYFDIPHLVKDRETKTYQVEKGNTYQFECRWEEGNPLRQIVLRGPGNKVLMESSAIARQSTLLRHTIRSDCSASGQYHCEVEGTRQFKNVTLLVKCPLKFNEGYKSPQRRVQTGMDATFTFNVTSYTTDFTSCDLTMPSRTPVNCEGNAKSEVAVRGSPPLFDVIVTVKNVTAEDEGTWTLTAANGEGHGIVSFGLSVTRPGAQKDSPYQLVVIGGACGGGFLIIVAVVSIIICLCRRRRKPCTKTSAPVASNTQPVSSGDDTEFNSHIYDEPDSPATVAPAPSVEVNARSSKADSSSDDYLEPIPGPAELAGAYESLEMAEVGQRSVYSQITTHGKWKKFLLRKK